MNRPNILVILTALAVLALSREPSGAAEPAGWENCLSAPSNQCMLSVARELAMSESYAPMRAQLLSQIAAAQAKAGLPKEARGTMELAEEAARAVGADDASHGSDFRAMAWAEVAKGWTKSGGLDRAIRLIEAAPDESARLDVIGAIGESLLEAGDIGAALKLVEGMKQPEAHLRLLPMIAEAQIKTGDMAEGPRQLHHAPGRRQRTAG